MHENVALHANADNTYHKLLQRLYWREMNDDVAKLVKGCPICNRNAPTTRRHFSPFEFFALLAASSGLLPEHVDHLCCLCT